jgi:hypothetical protein
MGVYATYDLEAAAAYCEAGQGDPKDFFIFYGYCGWEREQLHCELQRSIWYKVDSKATAGASRARTTSATTTTSANATTGEQQQHQQQQQQHHHHHQQHHHHHHHPVLELLRAESAAPELEDGVWGAGMASLGADFGAVGRALGGLEANELLGKLDERSVLRRYDDLTFVEDTSAAAAGGGTHHRRSYGVEEDDEEEVVG